MIEQLLIGGRHMSKEKQKKEQEHVETERVPEFEHVTEHPDGNHTRLTSDETRNTNTMYEQY